MLVTAGSPLSRSACFASTAPTKPTGRPMTRAGAGPRRRRSARAVGAVPMTHTAPGPTSPPVTRIPAAAPVVDLAHHLAGGDPGGRHRRVHHPRRAVAQRLSARGQVRFGADQVVEV